MIGTSKKKESLRYIRGLKILFTFDLNITNAVMVNLITSQM